MVDYTAVEKAATKVDSSAGCLVGCSAAQTAVSKDTKKAARWADDLALCWADWRDVHWAVMWVAWKAVRWAVHSAESRAGLMVDATVHLRAGWTDLHWAVLRASSKAEMKVSYLVVK